MEVDSARVPVGATLTLFITVHNSGDRAGIWSSSVDQIGGISLAKVAAEIPGHSDLVVSHVVELATPGTNTLSVGGLRAEVYVLRPPSFLVSLRSDPPNPFRGEVFDIVVRIENEGDQPGTYSSNLTSGNGSASFSVEVPPSQWIDRRFTITRERNATSYETITVQVDEVRLEVPIAEPIRVVDFSVAPAVAKLGEGIVATATLTNSAAFQVPYQVRLFIDSKLSQTREVDVPASGSTEVVFELSPGAAGEVTVAVGSFTGVVQITNELSDDIKSEYDVVDPLALAAAPNQWNGKRLELFGEIVNVQQNDTYTWIVLNAEVPGAILDESIIVRTKTAVASLVRGMIVRVYGTGAGTEEVQLVLTGATTNRPSVDSDYLLVEAASTADLAELYEKRYAESAFQQEQTQTKGNFKISLLGYGSFTRLQYITWGDRTTSFRVDFRVTNVGSQQDSIYSFNAALLDDQGGQYDADFNSTIDASNIHPGVIREGYLLFDSVNPDSNILRILWEDGYLPDSFDRVIFEFVFDAP